MFLRVLLINGDPLCKASASGLTMTHLFGGWPIDRLAQVFTSANEADYESCRLSWRLPPAAILFASKGHILVPPSERESTCSGSRTLDGNPVHTVWPRWEGRCRNELRNAMELFPYRLSTDFWEWVRNFSPDIVYSLLGGIRVMQVAVQVAEALRIPVVPHFMDDWASTLYEDSLLSMLLRPKLKLGLRNVFRHSHTALAIGSEMAAEYGRRYGGKFHAFMNCVDDERLDKPYSEAPVRDVVRFAYIGGLHLRRWKSLCDVGEALKRLRAKSILGELVIYGKVPAGTVLDRLGRLHPVVRLVGPIPAHDVPAAQEDADCLVHVESFEDGDRQYTRLSVSTKIPECLAAGRPILAYGPHQTASVQYVAETGCGRIVGQQNGGLLEGALADVIRSRDWRLQIGHRAKVIAGGAHRASDVRAEFRSVLAEAVDCFISKAPPIMSLGPRAGMRD